MKHLALIMLLIHPCYCVEHSTFQVEWMKQLKRGMKILSYYKRFNTGKGEILTGTGYYQLSFPVTLLVVTQYKY